MGQENVLDALKKSGWMTKKEISEVLTNLSVSSINESLRRLIKGGFIEYKTCKSMKHGFVYRLVDWENENENK